MSEKFARVEERGEQHKKLFVVVLSPDNEGREKDIRSFGVEADGRHDPVRQKAERFADRMNAAFDARIKEERRKAKVEALEDVEDVLCDVAQVFDGWAADDPKNWTDHDRSVRKKLSDLQRALADRISKEKP